MPPSLYRIDPVADLPFAREFMARPVGHHSPGLQRVLNLMRGEPLVGKYALICTKPFAEWQLAVLNGVRGQPVETVPGKIYTDLEDAERDVFALRWLALTGQDLVL